MNDNNLPGPYMADPGSVFHANKRRLHGKTMHTPTANEPRRRVKAKRKSKSGHGGRGGRHG